MGPRPIEESQICRPTTTMSSSRAEMKTSGVHPWHDCPIGPKFPAICNAVIEIPSGALPRIGPSILQQRVCTDRNRGVDHTITSDASHVVIHLSQPCHGVRACDWVSHRLHACRIQGQIRGRSEDRHAVRRPHPVVVSKIPTQLRVHPQDVLRRRRRTGAHRRLCSASSQPVRQVLVKPAERCKTHICRSPSSCHVNLQVVRIVPLVCGPRR